MGLGQGTLKTTQKRSQSGAPFASGAANNGLSVDPATGKIVLGNANGQTLADLLSNRFINMVASTINFQQIIAGVLSHVMQINANAQFQYDSTTVLGGNWVVKPFMAFATNTGAGGKYQVITRVGTSEADCLSVVAGDASGVNNMAIGGNINSFGAVNGVLTINGQTSVSIRSGVANAATSTEYILLTGGNLNLKQAIIFFTNAARSGTGSPVLRNNATGKLETQAGASGSFTTTDGKTVTVTDGIIVSIV